MFPPAAVAHTGGRTGVSAMMGVVARIELAIGILLLAATTLLVFAAAIARFLGHPIIWSVDLAQLLFIWLCFVGANRALRARAHLGVDLLVRRLPPMVRLVIEIALALLVVGFLVLLAVEGTRLTLLNSQRLFGDSGIPYAWVTMAVPVGCVILALTTLGNIAEAVRRYSERKVLVFSRIAQNGPQIEPEGEAPL
ncbi:TRAP transporter small permease [Afifella sp. IM 167]|uniref:TRAP transporter small permease n=1 Tax=Afifella sp. IM 167 TaxID=2033586 RepID=UPI001CCD93A3|nr:TRAP transporter small permease subunit [Afifella sp. IM 167]